MATHSISKTLVWILLGLLILGLGGFGVTNLSGTVRSVGSVGDVTIGVNDYANALQREIRAIEAERGEPVSFAEARDTGITQSVLARLVSTAAFDDEAARIGLSIGDENLRQEIVSMQQFQGPDGSFDREGYRFALERAGLSETEFEADMRDQSARGFLQAAVMSGVTLPKGYTDTVMRFLGERREVSWAVLGRDALTGDIPAPQEAELQAYHADHAARFTLPERKRITYVQLTPEMMLDAVEVDAAALRDAYEARRDSYVKPERRLVERLAFADTVAAQAARDRVDAGETDFDTLVTTRGLDLADVDLGDVTRDDLGEAAEAVFAAAVGAVAGPLPSPVGPALFRVNAKLTRQVTTFEEARPELRADLARDRARRAIEARIEGVENLLAGGATLEDVASETEMELGQINWSPGMTDGIAAYPAFREAAASVARDDYPELDEFAQGGIFALRLDEVVPAQLQPLEKVRAAVAAAWRADKLLELLEAQARPALARLSAGATFAQAGLSVDGTQTLTRRSFVAGTPASFIETVFSLDAGVAAVVPGEARVFVVKLARILPPDPEDEDLQALRDQLRNQAATSLSGDLFQLLANDIRTRAGIDIDQAALNAVHTNFR